MLARLPDLVQGLIEISYQRKWLEASIAAIKFGQHIIQALWTNNHSLQQLPYFGEAEVKHVTKSAGKQVKSLRDYLQLSDEEKTGMSSMTDEQKAEVLRVCSILPHLRVETQLFVEEEEPDFVDDDEDGKKSSNKNSSENVEEISSPAVAKTEQPPGDKIFEQDLVTLRVKLIRENVDEGKKSPPVYAPHFPRTLQESWWIVLTEKSGDKAGRTAEPNIHAFERVTNRSREVVHDIRFMAPPKTGEFEMELQIFSDCYMGLDVSLPIQFTVHPASELPEYQPHPEDLELDNEPTLFEQVMAANVDDDSSDDEDDKEEEEDSKTPPAKNSTAPRVNSSGGILVEDDSGSEEED